MDFGIAYDEALGAHDLVFEAGGFSAEHGLDTAIALSLFLDARADEDQLAELRERGRFEGGDPRGWWGDAFQSSVAGQYGSPLWLFRRAKLSEDTVTELRSAVFEALEWLTTTGIARDLEAEVELGQRGQIGICITITRQEVTPVQYRYVWDSIEGSAVVG